MFDDPLDKQILNFGQTAMDNFIETMVSDFAHVIKLYKQNQSDKFKREAADPWVLFVIED